MRLKQTSALLLASAMLVGSVGMMNPTEVRAEGATNTFTLTVPADTNITTSGWNDIGSVGVSNVSIAADKKISVTIGGGATGRTLKKTGDASKTIGYEVKKGNATTNEAFGTSIDFTANGTQAIGAMVNSFTGKPAGNYTDTITFTAKLEDKVTALTMKNASGETLAAADLGDPSAFTVNGKTYYAYNAFISKTSGSSWQNAMDFVKMLNDNVYDGHNDWILINDVDKAAKKSAIGTAWEEKYGSTDRGYVIYLWSSVEDYEAEAFLYKPISEFLNNCLAYYKALSNEEHGFLVLRGPSNASAAQGVEYTLTGSNANSKKLTSTALLASTSQTTFTYDDTTYTAYNGYISETSGANWNDGVAFVEALNAKEIDGRTGGWTLLTSKEMAYAWWLTTDPAEKKGASSFGTVYRVWTSGSNGDIGYSAVCEYAAKYWNNVDLVWSNLWSPADKTISYSDYGFVVLRSSSNASAATEVTYTRTEGIGTLSSANLGEPTAWTYNNITYQVYNEFIPSSLDSSWNDAMGFINALNTANYDGHNNWTLLSSEEMAIEYAASPGGAMPLPSDCGGVIFLWSSVPCDALAYCLRCDDNVHWQYGDKSSSSGNGFVVLRRSSN